MVVEGYKAFNSDWTCLGKQYTCPGVFEEDGKLELCKNGIHFCRSIEDCFHYYCAEAGIHIAKVMAIGDVIEGKTKCCTNKLVVIEEIPLETIEYLKNSGFDNIGFQNCGDSNIGSMNSGNCNQGYENSGSCNNGFGNTGNFNIGDENSGNWNIGMKNSGDYNIGGCNSGSWNVGYNCNGFFNTQSPKIYMFNKPTDLTAQDAYICFEILYDLRREFINWIAEKYKGPINEEGLKRYLRYVSGMNGDDITIGYINPDDIKIEMNKMYHTWFSQEQKEQILALPNFDAEIFKETTGIDVNEA